MFTARHDEQLWQGYLKRVLPNLAALKPVAELCATIYDDLERVRKLRNRIAHHEPIFARDIIGDLQIVVMLIQFRCQTTAVWMMGIQQVSAIAMERPVFGV